MNVSGIWQVYPVEESVRPMIEQSLGFSSGETAAAQVEPPKNCPSCQAELEVVKNEEMVLTRCTRCGSLSEAVGAGGLRPIAVEAPGGGWNGEFQALFEKNLGFSYKVRKNPPGIPE